MKKLFKEIKNICTSISNVRICSIDFSLRCQNSMKTIIFEDMMEYLPLEDHDCRAQENAPDMVSIYYAVDDDLFNSIKEITKDIVYNIVSVYHSRTVFKEAYHYTLDNVDIYYCGREPYYICTIENVIYTILKNETVNRDRLYFRIMVEFILRAKELMGYHFIHAACVSIGGKGILICGEKGAGKTTLLSHFLNSGEADFISNDKLFLSPDFQTVEYFPLATRVGEGTLRKFEKYDLHKKYHRISEEEKCTSKENYGFDKWEFTPLEMSEIFSCKYISKERFEAMLLAHISEDVAFCIKESNDNVLNYDLFANKRIDNWLLNKYWVERFTNLDKLCSNQVSYKYKVLDMKYNFNSDSQEIVQSVARML